MEIHHTETSAVSDQTLQTHISHISSYRDEVKSIGQEDGYNSPEAALFLPSDSELLQELKEVRTSLAADKLTDVVVVGMGGSIRGTQAVYDLLADESSARLHAIDSVSEHQIADTVRSLRRSVNSVKQLAVCIISKSGQTTETIANANVLLKELGDIYDATAVQNQTFIVSQPASQLQKQANSLGVKVVNIPEQISGRFSVLSASGLLPLLLAGVNIDNLTTGANTLRDACLSGRPTSDPAAALAAIIYSHMEENVRILNHFFFTPKAHSLGRWSQQLFAESLGKRTNLRGEPVFSGLYPVTTVAPDDLHADFQLQLGGPKNFFTIFVRARSKSGDLKQRVTNQGLLPETLANLEGKELGDIHQAIAEGAIESFREDGRPFVEITIPKFDAERVGQLLLLEQLTVMYLGHLLDINAFDQPQVEKYKDIARDKLSNF